MEKVHFVAKQAPLCGAPDARWCTILRDAVTCPECRRLVQERDGPRCARETSSAR